MSKPRQSQRILPYNYSQKATLPNLSQGEFLFAKSTAAAPLVKSIKAKPAQWVKQAKQ
jgi:hypothetical protein